MIVKNIYQLYKDKTDYTCLKCGHKAYQRKDDFSRQCNVSCCKQIYWDIETIFGNIKQNMNFKRFMLRGADKVETDFGLIAMAHNLKKMSLAIWEKFNSF